MEMTIPKFTEKKYRMYRATFSQKPSGSLVLPPSYRLACTTSSRAVGVKESKGEVFGGAETVTFGFFSPVEAFEGAGAGAADS
eukprot:CAMPEP_0184481300 /NCGR_PEP_ID=MMETSP0113_2-20130426/2850_1 /TAXON_ID=91329 /ORGANISM="Norrisiella sphaerica, Strain BC52" /LENGTH=82 /DNA_ID=CAMNT_0026860339 /DNA_START=640 /DNA_END=888 /DNA_ORIENTATION=+